MKTATNSPEYEEAIKVHNAAMAEFSTIRTKYRNMEIGDEEFLAARFAYGLATEAFDIAYAIEVDNLRQY